MGTAGASGQVGNHGAVGVGTTTGPFMRSSLPATGFALIEEAVHLISRSPCAVAQGVVEVWPLKHTP